MIIRNPFILSGRNGAQSPLQTNQGYDHTFIHADHHFYIIIFWDSIPSKWTHLHGLSLFFIILCLFSQKNINIGMVIPCSTHVYWVAHHEIPIFEYF